MDTESFCELGMNCGVHLCQVLRRLEVTESLRCLGILWGQAFAMATIMTRVRLFTRSGNLLPPGCVELN